MKIKHPSLPVERDAVDPDPWLAQGWVAVDAPEPAPEPAEGDDEHDAAPPKRRKR